MPSKMGSELRLFSRYSWARAGLFGLTALLVFLVALGSSRSIAHLAASRNLLDIRLILGDLSVVILGVLSAALCCLVYVLISGSRRRHRKNETREETAPPVPWWLKVIILLLPLALLGGVAAAVLLGHRHGSPSTPFSTPTSLPLAPKAAGSQVELQQFVVHWSILAGLGGFGLVLLLAIYALRRRRARPRDSEQQTERAALRAAVEFSLRDLQNEPDPRRAVIRTYANLECVLAEHGLARRSSETPLEYLARWVTTFGLSRSAAITLATLYERARFSRHVIDDDMKRDASAALGVLRRELEEGAS